MRKARLYLRIYLSFIGILAGFAVLVSIGWHLHGRSHEHPRYFQGAGMLAARLLPPPGADEAELERALSELASHFEAELALFDAGRSLLAASARGLPAPPASVRHGRFLHGAGRRGALVLALPDGRWLVARRAHRGRPGWRLGWLPGVALLAICMAIGAYPLARRITRRLERLKGRVEALGSGDLSARVEVEGRDEVADLAESFNRAAERIETLVEGQRTMLASASHELRTPLARIRMATELLAGRERPELTAQIAADIAELDDLIEELLLASRLQTSERVAEAEPVDLLALVAEEGARVNAAVAGEAVTLNGNRRLLRHLLRNLFENARRHGGEDGVEARVESLRPPAGAGAGAGAEARISVSDRGPGVPEEERERIFAPFYRPAGMRERGEGVGLGLYLVRQIARRHRGDARCEAAEGGGARFVVTLASIEAAQRGEGS